MLTSVGFRFRERQIPLDDDSPPRPSLPGDWQEDDESFSLESDFGMQLTPGEIDVESASRRHVVALAPREVVDADQPTLWPTFVISSVSHAVGGPLLMTDALSAGLVVFNGSVNPPARLYFIEGETWSALGIWRGLRRLWFWGWY